MVDLDVVGTERGVGRARDVDLDPEVGSRPARGRSRPAGRDRGAQLADLQVHRVDLLTGLDREALGDAGERLIDRT
ncbi:MAG TPA: hypothetical protein VGC42_10365 [Kofleriaceae bacterium]